MFMGGPRVVRERTKGDFSVELSKRVFGKCVYLQGNFNCWFLWNSIRLITVRSW